jgi:hypothetical protein
VEQIKHYGSTEGAGVNVVVLAEVSVRVEKPEAVAEMLQSWGMELLPLPVSAAAPAARAYSQYLAKREKKNLANSRIPQPDFLIGAHAEAEGMTLVTRDPDRIKTYFSSVKLIVPKG